MIELNNVTVLKGGRKLLDNFTFRIQPGEHWVIQGDNGSGKTSLLELLAGILHPASGQVHYSFIADHDWDTRYRQRLEKIHFVPTLWMPAFVQGFGDLFYQQRYYAVDNTQMPTVKDVFGEDIGKASASGFAGSFDISNLLDLPLVRLSNGQLKKVAILRQLVRNIPHFLLLDYPFDGLDAESRQDLSAFLDVIATTYGIQIVLVDHGAHLPNVINRRLVLDGGKILASEVLRQDSPQTPRAEIIHPQTSEISTGAPVVEMHDLTIAYNGKKIISNLNWRINRGERWALTGRNGSGKTTLFSLIFADHPMAYSQKVFLFGKRRGSGESIWDIKRRINYFGPEHIHFMKPWTIPLTGRQYIRMQGNSDSERLQALIDFFETGSFIDHPVRALSSGQLQLVMLMNVFLQDRELVLLDEPFQFLDPRNHQRVTKYLSQYLDQRATLVMITHDEKDVRQWTQLRKQL